MGKKSFLKILQENSLKPTGLLLKIAMNGRRPEGRPAADQRTFQKFKTGNTRLS
jgi:hypothetical protein